MDGPRLLPCHNSVAHQGEITTATLGPRTGLVFATGGVDKMLNLYSAGKDLPLIQFGELPSFPTCCQFERSEEIIVCGTNGGSAMMFDLAAERSISQWNVSSSSINAVSFDPTDSQCIATCTSDGKVQILSQNCKTPVSTFNISQKSLNSLAFSNDGQYIAVGGEEKVLNIYDVRMGQILAYHELHKGTINTIAWNSEGNIVMSGATDRMVRFFNIDTFREMEPTLGHNTASIASVRFLNKPNTAIAISSQLLSVVGYDPTTEYDRFKYSLGTVHDMQVIQNNVIIASSNRDHIVINRVKLDKLSPFSPYSKGVSPRREIRRSSEGKPSSYTMEGKIYNEFRKERAPYVTEMTERCSRITRLGDMISDSGVEKTIETVSQGGDLQAELASVVLMKMKSIKLESAAPLMNVANKLFETEPDVALSLTDAVLSTFGKLTFATMRTRGDGGNIENRRALCEEMLDAYRMNVPYIQQIACHKGPLRKVANDILLQWRSFEQ